MSSLQHNVPETIRTQWLERWAEYSPSKIAVKDDASGKEYSYAEMYAISNRISNVLQHDFAIGQGDRIAVLSQNCIVDTSAGFLLKLGL